MKIFLFDCFIFQTDFFQLKGIVNNTPIGRYWVALIQHLQTNNGPSEGSFLSLTSHRTTNCWEAEFRFVKGGGYMYISSIYGGRRQKLMTWVVFVSFLLFFKDTFGTTQKKTSKKWLDGNHITTAICTWQKTKEGTLLMHWLTGWLSSSSALSLSLFSSPIWR